MKSCYHIARLLLSALVLPLPLQAASHYEELAQKLLSHLPEQSSPMRLGVVNFSFPEDRKGLSDAEDVKDEMEVALGNDRRVKLISRTALHALEQEWNFQEGDLANPETKAVLSKVEGIDALVRGKVSLRENGEICIFAELMQVSNGAIMAKEKVSWIPAGAQPASPPQPAPQPQPVYQPAPQPQPVY
ncbi:MAG: hypothetical protein Q4E43_04655, partial [Akkermansia sp.]|nr:hypothetical protein [Akkermansia sp.]